LSAPLRRFTNRLSAPLRRFTIECRRRPRPFGLAKGRPTLVRFAAAEKRSTWRRDGRIGLAVRAAGQFGGHKGLRLSPPVLDPPLGTGRSDRFPQAGAVRYSVSWAAAPKGTSPPLTRLRHCRPERLARRIQRVRPIRQARSGASLEVLVPFSVHWPRRALSGAAGLRTIPLRRWGSSGGPAVGGDCRP
jgi:hypothetical protein